MKCADPVLCYTGKSVKLYRHFSLASHVIKTAAQKVFNCGQCLFCRKRRAYELASRCVLHASLYPKNCFLTLTYDEKRAEYHNNFEYSDIQKFKKRLRQYVWREHKQRTEIFNVHEYGKNGKKHWHLVVFNHNFEDRLLPRAAKYYTSAVLSGLWPHGFHTIGDVSEASAMYTAQYIEKDLINGNRHNSKKSHSKHSGIGKPYFLQHYKQILTLGYIPINGRKLPVPRSFQRIAHKHYCHYYERSAFFDSKERKALYRPFKHGLENRELADLYIQFKNMREEFIQDLEKEWALTIQTYLTTKEIPDFIKSGDNALYDLNKKQLGERF